MERELEVPTDPSDWTFRPLKVSILISAHYLNKVSELSGHYTPNTGAGQSSTLPNLF